MLKFLKIQSCNRSAWFLLLFSTVFFEACALYFQHGMNLQPCVLCIYERTAIFGIMFSALLALINPKSIFLRIMGLLIGLGSAIKGLHISLEHLDLQINPAPWKQCAVVANFPETLPLDQWLPAVFKPLGLCGQEQWQFLGVSMVQWIVAIFTIYILVFSLTLISQMKRAKPQRHLFR